MILTAPTTTDRVVPDLPRTELRVVPVTVCYLCRRPGDVVHESLRDRQFGAAGVWNLRRCTPCELMWLDPRPVPEDVSKLYLHYYTHSASDERKALEGIRRTVKRSILAGHCGYAEPDRPGALEHVLGRMLGVIPPLGDRIGMAVRGLTGEQKGRLLDVGCGNGAYLSEMRELGWDVFGVEPDPAAAEIARQRLGPSVRIGHLSSDTHPSGSMDAVTMSHVIEHVEDPIDLLRKCHEVLRPGGALVVITPNAGGLCHKALGRSWRDLDPPRHFHVFTRMSLGECVRRAGFRVQSISSSPRNASVIWRLSRLIQMNGQILDGRASLRLRAEGVLCAVAEYLSALSSRQLGEELVLTAAKEKDV
jgi:2-polyprenyl-3-methyl-5-hydroxy-6-metoxy-1,4-benzoquinol methylase